MVLLILMLGVMAAGLVLLAVLALDVGQAPSGRARAAARPIQGWTRRRFVDYRKHRGASGRVVGLGPAASASASSSDRAAAVGAGVVGERVRETGRLKLALA